MDFRYLCTRYTACILTVFAMVGTACAALPLQTPEQKTADTNVTEAAVPESTEAAAAVASELTITELTFAGNGDTFLERIEEVAATLDDLTVHRFVKVTDPAGVVWQGEALLGPAGGALLLQAQQSGSAHGVQIELAEDVILSEELLQRVSAELPTVETSAAAPDVAIKFVRARQSQPGVWRFDVTLNHADTGWEDYTDGWHVATVDGEILGTRVLLHPHEAEMPFTRGLSSVTVPDGVTGVLIRAHDLVSGYDPNTVHVPLGEAGSGKGYEVER